MAKPKWLSWVNHHRLMETLGCILPAEADANCDRQLTGQAATVAA